MRAAPRAAAAAAAAALAAAAAPPRGKYTATHGTIASVPGLSQGPPTSALIVYPKSTGSEKFPFISFAHGIGTGGAALYTDYSADLDTLASYGFIVVAPQSCKTTMCDFSVDQLATITACRGNPSLHPALASADFSKIGVVGHSMGAMATVKSASVAAAHGIIAAAAQHPCYVSPLEVAKIKVPIMYTAGSADATCAESIAVNAYAGTKSAAVLFSIKGASHLEPTGPYLFSPNREDAPTARFMACHLRGEQCDAIYGASGRAVCTQSFALSNCAVKGRPGPSPPAPPPPPAPPSSFTCKQNKCVAAASGLPKAQCDAACGGQ